jgi:hypothetical protein
MSPVCVLTWLELAGANECLGGHHQIRSVRQRETGLGKVPGKTQCMLKLRCQGDGKSPIHGSKLMSEGMARVQTANMLRVPSLEVLGHLARDEDGTASRSARERRVIMGGLAVSRLRRARGHMG